MIGVWHRFDGLVARILARRCIAVRARLSDLLAGELGDDGKRDLEQHLARCGRCDSVLSNLRVTVAALGGLDTLDGPGRPGAADRVMRAFRERAGEYPFRRRAATPCASVPGRVAPTTRPAA